MQTTFALAALAAVAYAAPQGVTADITPTAAAPAGCGSSYSGTFQITAVNTTVMRRDLTKRACGDAGSLTISLAGGQLTDAEGRTGYIASNYQFQFDKPAQDGAIYTGGFTACSNGSLALGGSAVFYECLSGGFYNLYDRSWAAQCAPILIEILPCSSSGAGGQMSDGQPTGISVATQISDGQPQAQSAIPISQISDGQPQVPTAVICEISDGQIQKSGGCVPITQISDGQIQASTAAPKVTATPVCQISDGQVQESGSCVPITQISDGQIQASTAAPKMTSVVTPICQISDGQVQKSGSCVPITQISDGQIQASTAAPMITATPICQISDGQVQESGSCVPITQISDGQIQATKSSAAPISQISDGQIQAGNATAPAATSAKQTVQPFTGAGNAVTIGSQFAAIVGAVAVLLL